MMEDDVLKDDEVEDAVPLDDELDVKKKGLLDDDVDSVHDIEEEEEAVTDEDKFDDENLI